MNGFTGFIGKTTNRSQVLENMMEKIVHRGPDSSDMFVEDEAAIGYRSLSNVNSKNVEEQYYKNLDSLVLAYDGLIYNAKELREGLISKGYVFKTETDSEILIHGYEEYAEKLLEKIRGVFAFVIWDRKSKKLFAARDKFGVKPFYYAHMNDVFFFGSEIKSFLPHPSFKKEFNEQALKPYLTFQYPVLNETFFKGVFKLHSSTYMTYENNKVTIKRYWAPNFNPTDGPLEELVDQISEVVKETVEVHQNSNVETGSFLSSGVDSSYVASIMKPEKTFTVGFSDKNFSEIDSANALSEQLGITNVNKKLDPDLCFDKLGEIQYMMDEPHSNPSIVPLYFLSELASQNVKVVLSGEGADELFGGYAEYETAPLMKKYKKVPSLIRKPLGKLAKSLPEMKGRMFLIKGGLPVEDWFIGQAKIFSEKEANGVVTESYSHAPTVKEIVKPFYDQVKNEDDVTKMQTLDLQLWLANDIMLKADKMSMAHSLEVRVPFMDNKVMEMAAKVPTKYRVNEIDSKYAFRLAATRSLPKEWANRKKIGFPVPIRHWIREEKYYEIIKASFESSEAATFFNQQKIIELLESHYKGDVNNGRKVWTIYMFLVWYSEYFGHSTSRNNI